MTSMAPVTNEQSQAQAPRAPAHNIFEDPAIAAAAQNDPFARWIIRNWRSIAGVLLAVAVGVMGYNRFTTVALEKRSAATTVLSGVQESYHQLVIKEESLVSLKVDVAQESDAAKKTELTTKIDTTTREVDQLRDKVALMVESLDAAPPFGLLKNLYKGLLAARRQQFDTTQSVLASHSWEQIGKAESPERFMGEMLTYGLARALIDSDAHREFARGQLVQLAERGDVAAVQAAKTLSLIAQSDAEKVQAQELVAKLRMKYPIQQRFLDDSVDSDS